MTLHGGVMQMRAVSTVEVKPGDKLELKPGGYHAMLSDLKQPLKAGDRFPLTLTFQHAGAIEVSVRVEAMGAKSTQAD
jgi:copper(I)-binding protein